MIRSGDGPAVTNGLVLGPDVGGRTAVLTTRGAILGPALDHQLSEALDRAQGGMASWMPRPTIPRGRLQRAASLPVPWPGRPDARHRPDGQDGFLGDETEPSSPEAAAPRTERSGWPRLHRFVSLSGLGWAFVIASVLWECFALVFSERVGWGWDMGALFFAWGLGILALGFCLRTSPIRPACSRCFLGANVVVLAVLGLVVATSNGRHADPIVPNSLRITLGSQGLAR
jgi:hypothetical protein